MSSLEAPLIHWLWLVFVFIGLTLFITAAYFRRESKRLSKALSDLYALNQSVNQDALDFFDQSWPILSSLGCLKVEANIEWFGEKKHIVFGDMTSLHGKSQVFYVSRDEMAFKLKIMLNRKASESGSLSFLVIKTFINMLEQNLVLKQAEILTSQKRLERYQLFIQHEIKNIAQFIQLLSEQVVRVEAEQDKIRLIERLQKTLPTMAERAKKTVLHMSRSSIKGHECNELQVHLVLQEVVSMYHLQANIIGEATICLPSALLIEAFKNILGNFRDHELTQKEIRIVIEAKASHARVRIFCQRDKITSEIRPERLFEPFWTTSESGMGLGLFLARELLKQMNGTVQFEQGAESFGFLIKLPFNR
ncbi:MAG: ATP-binding protein [Thiomicrorhabdus sp.]|nr:ATP-binding protein [Thiomicrorhabdus sp.]MCF6299417.1 ATP-binding protein [Thiomicrorhabdus sp.]